jgi:hypothetical protein
MSSTETVKKRTNVDDMSLLSITDGDNGRGIPLVKFIDDVEEFANTFSPPASAELLIGAYSELHNKFKTFEATLAQKSKSFFRKTGTDRYPAKVSIKRTNTTPRRL